jgi:hypothetical protein
MIQHTAPTNFILSNARWAEDCFNIDFSISVNSNRKEVDGGDTKVVYYLILDNEKTSISPSE